MTSRRVVLTGSTTIIGAEVLRRLFARPEITAIHLLLPAEESVRERAAKRLEAHIGSLPTHVVTTPCDLRLPRFGMSPAKWKEFADSFDLAVHCAQRDIKDQNLILARQANLLPVENWIDLLEMNQELRLHQLSTAFVAGNRCGLFTEFDLACGQSFRNAWEQSLFEAEARLRDSRVSDRVTIYRPSHILGPTASAQPFDFGGAYPLFGTLAAAAVVPGDTQARIDVVPADFVASAMVALIVAEATGTFHLACGWEDSLPVGRAAALAAKSRQRQRAARIVPRAIAWPLSLVGTASTSGSRRLAFAVAGISSNTAPPSTRTSLTAPFLALTSCGPHRKPGSRLRCKELKHAAGRRRWTIRINLRPQRDCTWLWSKQLLHEAMRSFKRSSFTAWVRSTLLIAISAQENPSSSCTASRARTPGTPLSRVLCPDAGL